MSEAGPESTAGERRRKPTGGRPTERRPGRLQRKQAARQLAVQALYQWDLGGGQVQAIVEQFDQRLPEDANFVIPEAVDRDYFLAMLRGISGSVSQLDAHLEPLLDRPVDQLDPVERCVLRAGAWELAEQRDVPWRVVINEAIELSKDFGATDAHKYVNGVLDKLAARLRPEEHAAPRKRT